MFRVRPSSRRTSRAAGVATGALAIGALWFAVGTGIGAQATTPPAEDPVTTAAPTGDVDDPCPDNINGPDSEPWIQVELYFSQPRGDADAGNDDLYMKFLDEEVTPRFPAGLTMLSGVGQWQGSDGDVGQSRSHVLIILYPAETAVESSQLIEEIRDEYETQFDQQSVMRADTQAICTSF